MAQLKHPKMVDIRDILDENTRLPALVAASAEKLLGLERLNAIHLNDSMTPFSSFKDRHETIGKGSLGEQAFINIINHPVLRELPFFLETPRDDAGHGEEITWLKEHYRN